MSTNVLDKLSYGLYILSSTYDGKSSGCIIDACIQSGTNPDQILIAVMNKNFTREIIERSGVFCIAVLSESCPFEMIKHFGFQSSKNVDKFKGLTNFTDLHGVPCVLSHVCATISARVIERIDLGSHTVFVGEVRDQKLLDEAPPMTYLYYREKVKPAPSIKSAEENIIGWRCTICGFIYSDPMLPDDYMCAVCGHPSSDFVPIYG